MANNRGFFVCLTCLDDPSIEPEDARFFLLKYYPSQGWYTTRDEGDVGPDEAGVLVVRAHPPHIAHPCARESQHDDSFRRPRRVGLGRRPLWQAASRTPPRPYRPGSPPEAGAPSRWYGSCGGFHCWPTPCSRDRSRPPGSGTSWHSLRRRWHRTMWRGAERADRAEGPMIYQADRARRRPRGGRFA